MEKFLKFGLLLTVCLISFSSVSIAQDVIIKTDSTKINAKVLEVNIENIRYKNFDYMDGPIYTILKSDVDSIHYKNGQTDIFTQEKAISSTLTDKNITLTNTENIPFAMKTHNPDLYIKYMNGDRMRKNGYGLIFTGVFSTMLGAAFVISATNIFYDNKDYQNIQKGIGYGLIVTGDILLAVGIPVHLVGKSKRRSALKEFHNQYNSASSSTSHFQLNLNSNGVGVSFVFGK